MKKVVRQLKESKFKRFVNGLLFAIISMISILLCMVNITDQNTPATHGVFLFIITIISMAFGFYFMFRDTEPQKQKY